MKRSQLTAQLLFGLALTAGTAMAQPASPAAGSQREGFLIGLSIGSGFSSTYRPCFDLHLGGVVSKDLVALVEFYGLDKGDDQAAGIVAAGVQFWPADRIWLRGGIGYGSIDSEARLAGLAGVGYEIVRSGRFALDIQVRGLLLKDGSGASFNIGFNWY